MSPPCLITDRRENPMELKAATAIADWGWGRTSAMAASAAIARRVALDQTLARERPWLPKIDCH